MVSQGLTPLCPGRAVRPCRQTQSGRSVLRSGFETGTSLHRLYLHSVPRARPIIFRVFRDSPFHVLTPLFLTFNRDEGAFSSPICAIFPYPLWSSPFALCVLQDVLRAAPRPKGLSTALTDTDPSKGQLLTPHPSFSGLQGVPHRSSGGCLSKKPPGTWTPTETPRASRFATPARESFLRARTRSASRRGITELREVCRRYRAAEEMG